MRETHEHQENAVLLVRRVRDLLNREIEAMTGKALLDHVHGHRYTSPRLQRLASTSRGRSTKIGANDTTKHLHVTYCF